MPENASVSSPENAPERRAFAGRSSLWLGVIIAAGVALRLIALGYKSFWIDEIASVAIARRASSAFWHFLWHDEGNMAAYYVLLRPWLHLGYGEATVRLLSVVPGIASLPLMYVLARKLFGVRVAMASTLFLAFNACAIYVSQEARAYSFVVFAVLLSTYLFVLLVERPTYGAACAYALAAGLSCYFHYFSVLVPAAHYVSLAGRSSARRPWKFLLSAASLAAILAAPVLWLMHAQDTGHISWVQPTSWLEVYHLAAYLSAASGKAVGGVLLAFNLVLIGFFVKDLARSWADDETRWGYLLVASLVAVPILLTVLASAVRPSFYHRFLIICLPGWILMTAIGAETIRPRASKMIAVGCVCVLSLASTVILYHRVTEDWRSAVHQLIEDARPNDRVLYYQSVGEFAGENYRDWLPGGNGPRPKSIPANGDGNWKQQINDAPRVWLVLYRAKATDFAVKEIQESLEQREFRLKNANTFPGVTVMEFAKQ